MKNKTTLIVIIAILAILVIWVATAYNGLVKSEETVEQAWSNVENQYERRLDLIPNLVNTVKGYATHEQETFRQVTEARANATQVSLNVDELTEENLQRFQQAQGQLNSALSRLLAVAESYPELKANTNFLEFQAQLEGTENRIAVERRNFNEAAQSYNRKIRSFPGNVIAGLFGFERKAYFQASEGAERAPSVQF